MPDTAASDLSPKEIMANGNSTIPQALNDIVRAIGLWRIWLALSWQEFSRTYRRSLLGIAWVMLGFAFFVLVKILIFSSLLSAEDSAYYDTYLLLGFFIWMFLQRSVTASPNTFTSAKGWICSEPLPLTLYIWKNVMREFYQLALTAVVVVVVVLILRSPIQLSGLPFSLIALGFLLLNAFSIKLLLGVINARIRDLSHLIKALMLPMLFMTPIFWTPEQMGELMTILWWNPFFHYLEIFRSPLLTGRFPAQSWIFVLTLNALISLVAFALFARYRQRIVFWL